MVKTYLRTGQAAKELGVSSHHVRKLCEAGLIEDAEYTGKQWRIPLSEVEKLQREGIPSIPQAAEPARHDITARSNPNSNGYASPCEGLPAEPSEDVIESAEDVVVTGNRLRKRKLDRELEETEDWFRDRDEREAARTAAQEREEQEQYRQAEAAREHREWSDRWTGYALDSLPNDCPREYRPDVHQEIEAVLATLHPDQPESTVQRIVDGAVEKALRPWKRVKEIEKAIERACDNLPFGMKYSNEWKHRAARIAREAISNPRSGAALGEMENATSLALKPLVAEFEHEEKITRAASSLWQHLPGATGDELHEAAETVAEALSEVSIGATDRQIEVARTEALAPIRQRITAREDIALRQRLIGDAGFTLTINGIAGNEREDALDDIRTALAKLPGRSRDNLERARDRVIDRYRQRKDLIESTLQGLSDYVEKLHRKYEFEDSAWQITNQIRPDIQEALAGELEGDEDPEEAAQIMRRLVREELNP